jgi:hypothetical protein
VSAARTDHCSYAKTIVVLGSDLRGGLWYRAVGMPYVELSVSFNVEPNGFDQITFSFFLSFFFLFVPSCFFW